MQKRISMAMPVFNGKEKDYLDECIETGWVSANGRFVTEFEEKFAEFCNVKYALSCSNGTVALHLCLLSLGLGAGDEVIMPTLTYIATANCVRYCGATPVFVDSDALTFNIDASKIEEKITSRTKAILPVHLYGLPCDMDAIQAIAKKHNLFVIEDAAEAHGAMYNGKRVGSIGDVAAFSFFGNKIITSGEGGMVVTNNKDLYERIKLLKGQGVDPHKRYWHSIVGYNYRMTNMQAAVGLAQLENVEWHMAQRIRVMELYKSEFNGYSEWLRMQETPRGRTNVYWMNNVVLSGSIEKSRDQVMSEMEARNIEMRPVFYPMHIMPPYYCKEAHFPVAEGIAARGISLPSHALLSQQDVRWICDSMKEICGL